MVLICRPYLAGNLSEKLEKKGRRFDKKECHPIESLYEMEIKDKKTFRQRTEEEKQKLFGEIYGKMKSGNRNGTSLPPLKTMFEDNPLFHRMLLEKPKFMEGFCELLGEGIDYHEIVSCFKAFLKHAYTMDGNVHKPWMGKGSEKLKAFIGEIGEECVRLLPKKEEKEKEKEKTNTEEEKKVE